MNDIKDAQIECYLNLRKHWQKTVNHVLGEDYYNMGIGFQDCDEETCYDMRMEYDRLKQKIRNLYFWIIVLVGVLVWLVWNLHP